MSGAKRERSSSRARQRELPAELGSKPRILLPPPSGYRFVAIVDLHGPVRVAAPTLPLEGVVPSLRGAPAIGCHGRTSSRRAGLDLDLMTPG
jgi:hypothetical protein